MRDVNGVVIDGHSVAKSRSSSSSSEVASIMQLANILDGSISVAYARTRPVTPSLDLDLELDLEL